MELVTIITELLEQKKYASLRDILTEMHPADVATMFDELE